MGQISRMNRAGRFITEFSADFCKGVGEPGEAITIEEIFLTSLEGHGEEVVLCYRLKGANCGAPFTLICPDFLFDPEYDNGEDLVERVAANLNISEEEARERLKKANLL